MLSAKPMRASGSSGVARVCSRHIRETAVSGRKTQDFPPGLQGGLEHDDEDHRIGETGQTGPESPGDLNRGHPEQDATKTQGEGAQGTDPKPL